MSVMFTMSAMYFLSEKFLNFASKSGSGRVEEAHKATTYSWSRLPPIKANNGGKQLITSGQVTFRDK